MARQELIQNFPTAFCLNPKSGLPDHGLGWDDQGWTLFCLEVSEVSNPRVLAGWECPDGLSPCRLFSLVLSLINYPISCFPHAA